MPKKFFLVSAFGQDRPGMAAAITRALFELGGNIEDASMTRLGGEFSIMLVVGLPAAVSSARLEKALGASGRKAGLQSSVKPIASRLARTGRAGDAQYLISVYGKDRTGIVYHVTQALANQQASITDLNTRTLARAGGPLYVMLLEIRLSKKQNLDDLRSELDRLRQELKVDITLQDIEAVAL